MPSPLLLLCLTLAVVGSLGAAVAAWPRRDDPVVRNFLLLTFGAALWSGGRVMELISPLLEHRILWAQIQYLGIVAVPPAWLFAMIRLSRPRRVVPWSSFVPPVLVALVTLVLVFTNENHHLIWASVRLNPPGTVPAAKFEHGPAYLPIAAWNYLMLFISLGFLATARVPTVSLSRLARGVLSAGLVLPLAAHVAYLRGWTGPLGGDLTPATFAIMGLLVWFFALRNHLDDLGHYARLRVFDALREGCVIISPQGRVVECNVTAMRLLPALRSGDEVPPAWTDALAASRDGATRAPEPLRAGEWEDGVNGDPAEYELTLEPVRGLNGKLLGTIAFLRDVSSYRLRETALTVQLDATEQRLLRMADDLDRDPLTGLHNRRHFQRVAGEAVAQAHQHAAAVALFVLDVDNFKPYNDRHGHVAGDDCLRRVAHALAGALPNANAACARLGGEEFAVVLPAATLVQTRALGEALVESIRKLKLPHGGLPGQPFVTISVGAVCRVPPAPALDAMLQRADLAMYTAKRSGRDGFVLADSPEDVMHPG